MDLVRVDLVDLLKKHIHPYFSSVTARQVDLVDLFFKTNPKTFGPYPNFEPLAKPKLSKNKSTKSTSQAVSELK
jgi:hypothetical protein